MLITCYYYDEVKQSCFKTTYRSMISLEKTDYAEFLRRKANLFRREDRKISMVLVKNGLHRGFRRKGDTGGNYAEYSRGEHESLTHQGNKEILSQLEELKLSFGDEEVTIYIEYAECEKTVICNGRRYEIDIYFKLARTDPEVYFDKWGGELWFEVYHTCRVDRNQAEDFAIENKTLFEFKIPETSCFYDYITDEGYIKRQATLKKWYSERGVKGLLICQNRGGSPCRWYKSSNGNMTARIDGTYYTVIKNKFDSNYGIMYGNGLLKWEYNQKKFQTEKEAMKMAEYFAFIIYNNEKIQ